MTAPPAYVLSRRVRRALAYGAELAMPVPRTVGFVAGEWLRGRTDPSYPAARISPGFVAQAALDEWLVAVMKTPGRYPRRDGYLQAGRDILQADDLHRRRGWTDDPASYHRAPPPPSDVRVRQVTWPVAFEHLTFASGFEPDAEEPGRERWLAHAPNRTAHAWVLRRDRDAPWLVCLHAFGMGFAHLDLWAFRAAWLHRELGLNVVFPVLPLHGPRRVGTLSGSAFMSYNLVDVGHGIAQSVWDVRRVLQWVRGQGGSRVGLYGVSLGSHVAGIVAGVEPDLDCVIAGAPTCDFTELFARHTPRRIRSRAREHGLIGEAASRVHRVVTPLAIRPQLPPDRLAIYASLGDRMATPGQAYALWKHWGEPRIDWWCANHVAFLWSKDVSRFVRELLRTHLL